MDDRLPAGLEAAALRRQVEAEGGTVAILHRGDPDRGSLLLLIASRGIVATLLERALGSQGTYGWIRRDSDAVTLAESTRRRIESDPDSWLIELDVADPQRFIAQFVGEG